MHRLCGVLIVCLSLLLVACVESKSELEAYVAQIKKTAKGKVEPLPAIKPIKQVTYSAQNLRSPFVLAGGAYNVPAVITGPSGQTITQAPRPDLNRPREYLEQFPLSSFVMVGTLSKPNLSWGLIKGADGMIHAVKVGDYLGLNSGIIIAITNDQIRLNETVPNGAGGWMQSRAAINLLEAQQSTEAATTTTDDLGRARPAGPPSKANNETPKNVPAQTTTQPQQMQLPQTNLRGGN